MKILVVCQYYYPEPFRITDICESLVKRGHQVTVLTGLPNYPEGVVHEKYRRREQWGETINGVDVIRCFEVGRGTGNLKLFINYLSFTISASLKALLMKKKFDVIFVNQLSPISMAIPAFFYKKMHRKNIVLYCLDLWPESLIAGGIKEKSMVFKLIKWISKLIYNSVDSILVSSNMFKTYFRENLKINSKNVEYLPQYAENIFLDNIEYEFKTETDFNFVFAGNVGDMQSVETIVKAANELKHDKRITFHIVGNGSSLESCKKMSKDFELKNIRFYGRLPVSQMPKFYSMADAMLITLKDNMNISYTLPGKVQSYMAAGKPIIGAINGETNHVVTEAQCGIVCAAEDYLNFAQIINEYCESEISIKENMALNSYKYYMSNFSKEKFIRRIEKKLEEMRK